MEYVIADFHAYHFKIILYERRPFMCAEEMNQVLIQNYNNIITDKDVVWVLGDVSLGGADKTRKFVDQLKGRKRLIKGNHDKQSKSFWLKAGIEKYYKEPVEFGNYILSHEPIYDSKKTNVHGHVHSLIHKLNPEIHKCVSVECTGYRPVLLNDVLSGKYQYKIGEYENILLEEISIKPKVKNGKLILDKNNKDHKYIFNGK